MFKRLPFGFLNSMQHFNTALALSMTEMRDRLHKKGLDRHGGVGS